MAPWDSVTSMTSSSTKDKTPEKPESKPRADQKDAVGDRMAAETDAVAKKGGEKPDEKFKSKQVKDANGDLLAPEITIDDGSGNGKGAKEKDKEGKPQEGQPKDGKPEAKGEKKPDEPENNKPEDPKQVELRKGLESETAADRTKAVDELLKRPEKLGAEDIKALAHNLTPEALKAIGALPEAQQAKLKEALLKELQPETKAKPTDAASQRQYEKAFEGVVALGGRQALKDMGLKLEESPHRPDEFSLKTENGTTLNFKKEANDTVERMRLAQRPNDGGFLRVDYEADGSFKGSYEATGGIGDRTRFNIERNKDGQITKLERPDRTTIQVDYKDGVAVGLKDSSGSQLKSADGKTWTNELGLKVSTEGTLTVSKNGDVRIAGEKQESVTHADRTTTVTDKVKGTTTNTRSDGTVVTTDKDGRVTETVDRKGAHITYEYGKDGELSSYTDAKGKWAKQQDGSWKNETTSAVEQGKRWVSADGAKHEQAQDGKHVARQLDGSRQELDSQGRITQVTDARGRNFQFEYQGDEKSPNTFEFVGGGAKWRAANPEKTEWVKLGKDGNPDPSKETWSGTVEVKDGVYKHVSKSGVEQVYNSDGSQLTRVNGRIAELTNARGDNYKFGYDDHGLSEVTRPDGSKARVSRSPYGGGWRNLKDNSEVYGIDVDQQTGKVHETDKNWRTRQVALDGTKTEYEFTTGNLFSTETIGGFKTNIVRAEGEKGGIVARQDTTPDGKTVESNTQGRVERRPDKSAATYDRDGNLVVVDRADGHKIQIERGENGIIKKITDSKGPLVWESQDGKKFTRSGNIPLTVEGTPFVKENGDYGFKGADGKTIERTGDSLDIRRPNEKVQLKDDGSSLVYDAAGKLKSSEDANGVVRSVVREKGPDGNERVSQAIVGNTLWTRSREGQQNEWTSNDGRKFTGEMQLDQDGTFRMVAADKGFETVSKTDGSTIFRDSAGRVHRTISGTGAKTDYAYDDKGALSSVTMPDGKTLVRAPAKPGDKPSETVWSTQGSSDLYRGDIQVDRDGRLHRKEPGQAERIRETDGWESKTGAQGKRLLVKENANGSTVTKNEKGQIIETKTAIGGNRKFGYDESGNLNHIEYGGGEKWDSKDGGKTWTKQGAKPEDKPMESKVVLTADGDLVESSKSDGKNVERVLRNDGSILTATDGKVTKVATASGVEYNIGYGADGKPNSYADSREGGTSWKSEDGHTWKKYSKDGKAIESEQRPQQFEIAVNKDGSVVKKYKDHNEERYDIMRTDGGKTVVDAKGNKIAETKIVKEGGSLRAVDAQYQRDKEGKAVGRTEQRPDGTLITTDAQGRVTEAKLGDAVRKFTYEGTSKMPVGFEEGGKKFTLNKEELKKGRAIYESEGTDPNRPKVAGLMEVMNDGSVHMLRGDKSEMVTRLDGSRTIRFEDGTQRTERPDGKLAEIVRLDGTKVSFKYDLRSDVLGRPGQLSEQTIETKDGAKTTWTTSDGFHWRGSNGKNWNGFTSVDQRTGVVTDRHEGGNTAETRMDGQQRQNAARSFDAWGVKDKTVEALDYWWQSNKIEGVRNALKDLDAEQTYMVRNAYNQGDASALRNKAWHAFEEGDDTHRWKEADGYLRRTGKPGENAAIQLAVDAQEVDRWWFNRDRSKEEILSSTRHILGSASEAERQNIDAANRGLYGQGLADFYGKGGDGAKIANWDAYHQALIGVAVEKGVDARSPQQQADIMAAALTVPGKKLDYFMEASGKGFSTEDGRKLFEQNAGADKIRYAFTEQRYTEDGGSYEVQDQAGIEAATDFMQRGELRPLTQFKRALGTFSNDDKAMDDALGRLKPEERAQLADGKQLFDSFKSLAPDAREKAVGDLNQQQREALEQYEKWSSAFRDAHWFGKDRKAGRYEDKALVEGGTDVGKVVDIGGDWFNSHQTNAKAVENLDRKSFDQLMTGATVGADGQPKSQYLDRFLAAQDKNLGSGDYKQRAQQLIKDKVSFAVETNKLADAGDLDGLRGRVPQLASVSDADWNKLKGGYQLDKQLASGAKKEGDLTADERAQLEAYRQDKNLQPFMKGRELQRQLDQVESGQRLAQLKQGNALEKEIKDQKRKEADLKPEEKTALDLYRANQKEWAAIDLTMPESARAKQRELMLGSFGQEGQKALEAYRQGLYDATKDGSRRSLDLVLMDAEAEGGVFSSTDKKAILDGIVNMKTDERVKYHAMTADERTAYNNRVMKALGGAESTNWKAAESLLSQIEKDTNATPAKPTMGLKEELYAQSGNGYLDRHKGFEMIRDALAKDKDGELAKKLASDESYKAAVARTMGSDGYDKYVKPLVDTGRLPAATLRELNTHIVADGGEGGGTHEEFDQSQYFKDSFLNATPKGLASLKADPKELEQVMSSLSPEQKKIAQQILNPGNGPDGKPLEPQVRAEDKLRAFYLGAGITKEEARDILSSLPEQERARAVLDYAKKYGSQMRQDLLERVDNKDKDQFVRLTRTGDWSTEVAYLHQLRSVASTDAGIGAAITRDYNTMHRDALAGFEEAKREAKGNLSPEDLRKHEEAVEKAVDAFKESKEATAETVTTGIITAGALVAAPFSGGTSLYAIIAAGGVIGAGTKYALLGNDTEGFKQVAGDFVKYSALTAANVLGPEHIAAAMKLGTGAATRATTAAFANAGIKGVTHEVEAQVLTGMKKLVQEGITHGGGVTDDAIKAMVKGVNGLDDAAKAQLTKSLQESLASSLRAEAAQGLKGVLNSARMQGQSLVLNGVAGAGGNVIGEIGQQLIRDGKLNMDQLEMAALTGAAFAVPIAGAMKVGGYGFKKAFGAAENLHPGKIGETPSEQLHGMKEQWGKQPDMAGHAKAEQEFRDAFQKRLADMPAANDTERAQNFLKAVEESKAGGDGELAQSWRKLQAEREALIAKGFDPADGLNTRLNQVQNLADQMARDMGVEPGKVILDPIRAANGVVRDGDNIFIHPNMLSGGADQLDELTNGLSRTVKEGKFARPEGSGVGDGVLATADGRNAAMNVGDASAGRNGVPNKLDELIGKYSQDYKDVKWYHAFTSPRRYFEANGVRKQLEKELMDEAKQVAKQMGLPEGLVSKKDLGLVDEIKGAAGSYGAADDFLKVSAQKGTEDLSHLTPSLTLRHEMRHRAMAIERTAIAKADPDAYRALIRDEVVGNAGKGGLRASKDAEGKWVLEQRLSDMPGTPADRVITKEQATYLRDNLDAYLKENGEALQKSGKLPSDKQMADWLAKKTGQPADPRLVKEMVAEVNHYDITHRTSIIGDDVVNGKPVLKATIEARAQKYRETGNVHENPKAQTLVKSISDDTTGIAAQSDDAAGSYYKFSVEELRARRIEHRENLTRLNRELDTVDVGNAAKRKEIETSIEAYKQAIKYDNAKEGFVNDLLAVRNAPAAEQAAAVAKAQQSARDLLKMAPEDDLGEIGNHVVRNGILKPSEVVAAVPDAQMTRMTANLVSSGILDGPAGVTRVLSELPDAKARSLINGLMESKTFSPREVLSIAPESQMGATAEIILKNKSMTLKELNDAMYGPQQVMKLSDEMLARGLATKEELLKATEAGIRRDMLAEHFNTKSDANVAQIKEKLAREGDAPPVAQAAPDSPNSKPGPADGGDARLSSTNNGQGNTTVVQNGQTAKVGGGSTVEANGTGRVEIVSDGSGKPATVALKDSAQADVNGPATVTANPGTHVNAKPQAGQQAVEGLDLHMSRGSSATITDGAGKVTGSGRIEIAGNNSKIELNVPEGETMRVIVKDGDPEIKVSPDSKGRIEVYIENGRELPDGLRKHQLENVSDDPRVVMLEKADLEPRNVPSDSGIKVLTKTEFDESIRRVANEMRQSNSPITREQWRGMFDGKHDFGDGQPPRAFTEQERKIAMEIMQQSAPNMNSESVQRQMEAVGQQLKKMNLKNSDTVTVYVSGNASDGQALAHTFAKTNQAKIEIKVLSPEEMRGMQGKIDQFNAATKEIEEANRRLTELKNAPTRDVEAIKAQVARVGELRRSLDQSGLANELPKFPVVFDDLSKMTAEQRKFLSTLSAGNKLVVADLNGFSRGMNVEDFATTAMTGNADTMNAKLAGIVKEVDAIKAKNPGMSDADAVSTYLKGGDSRVLTQEGGGQNAVQMSEDVSIAKRKELLDKTGYSDSQIVDRLYDHATKPMVDEKAMHQYLADIEAQYQIIQAKRAKEGLPPLKYSVAEYQSAAMMSLEHNTHFNDYPTMVRQMHSLDNAIKENLKASGLNEGDYLIVTGIEKDGSSHLVTHLYGKANNIPPERFISVEELKALKNDPEKAKQVLGGKRLITLDDYRNSGQQQAEQLGKLYRDTLSGIKDPEGNPLVQDVIAASLAKHEVPTQNPFTLWGGAELFPVTPRGPQQGLPGQLRVHSLVGEHFVNANNPQLLERRGLMQYKDILKEMGGDSMYQDSSIGTAIVTPYGMPNNNPLFLAFAERTFGLPQRYRTHALFEQKPPQPRNGK